MKSALSKKLASSTRTEWFKPEGHKVVGRLRTRYHDDGAPASEVIVSLYEWDGRLWLSIRRWSRAPGGNWYAREGIALRADTTAEYPDALTDVDRLCHALERALPRIEVIGARRDHEAAE